MITRSRSMPNSRRSGGLPTPSPINPWPCSPTCDTTRAPLCERTKTHPPTLAAGGTTHPDRRRRGRARRDRGRTGESTQVHRNREYARPRSTLSRHGAARSTKCPLLAGDRSTMRTTATALRRHRKPPRPTIGPSLSSSGPNHISYPTDTVPETPQCTDRGHLFTARYLVPDQAARTWCSPPDDQALTVSWRRGTKAMPRNPDAIMRSRFVALHARPAGHRVPRAADGSVEQL